MKATYYLIRFLKLFSLLVFVALLFLAYYNLPNPVAIQFTSASQPAQFVDKQVFFYAAGILVVLFNMILSVAARFIIGVPAQIFPMPNRNYWLADKESRLSFLTILRNWLNSLVFIANLLLSVCLLILMKLNNAEGTEQSDYSWILLAGLAALCIWLFFLPVRLLIKSDTATN